jgi:hypothetical protein
VEDASCEMLTLVALVSCARALKNTAFGFSEQDPFVRVSFVPSNTQTCRTKAMVGGGCSPVGGNTHYIYK